MKSKNHKAILASDVVDSSFLSEEDKKSYQLKIENYSDNGILLRPKFCRGDSFQLASKPFATLFIALKIRNEIEHRKTKMICGWLLELEKIHLGKKMFWWDTGLVYFGGDRRLSNKNQARIINQILFSLIKL